MNSFVHDTDEEALLAMFENPNLEQAHVTLLLGRLDLPANVWSAVARKGNWRSSKGVRVRLARHPCAPKRIALAAVRQLHLFDLVGLSLLRSAPTDVRRFAEEVILSLSPSSRWEKNYRWSVAVLRASRCAARRRPPPGHPART